MSDLEAKWSQFVVLEMNIDQMPAKEGQKLVEILNVDDKDDK